MTTTSTRRKSDSALKSLIHYDTALPPGVVVVKDYPAGYSLCECGHNEGLLRPTGGWCSYRDQDHVRTLDGSLSEREARTLMQPGETLDYYGSLLCIGCKADEWTTNSFKLAVKFLAVVSDNIDRNSQQEGLF